MSARAEAEDAWLWGWNSSRGIVSVHAEPDGQAYIYRRLDASQLVVETERFEPFVLLASLEQLAPHDRARFRITELEGEGELRYRVNAAHADDLRDSLLRHASTIAGRKIASLRELEAQLLVLPPEEQYLSDTGKTSFRGLSFDDVRRMHFDLETTGLDPRVDRIFLIAIRSPDGEVELIEDSRDDERGEAEIIRRLFARIAELDPDVIENHNLHGFDLPFLLTRARRHRIPPRLGREPAPYPRARGARRGASFGAEAQGGARIRFTVAGRELIDTMDAVLRRDFAARDLPGHGLKVVARHLGVASDDRELIHGARVHAMYRIEPERVRRYARADVEEAAAVGRLLGGAAFALATMAPRRYERLSDAGPATGVIDPLIARAYLREGRALPARAAGDGIQHSGAALHLFAAGVAHRIVKADVASLYPSLMRQYRIGPARDSLGVLLALVDRLVELRLEAKARSKRHDKSAAQRREDEALAAAMKIVVNSAYGYLGATGLTRFADVNAANEVTRRGRALLAQLCRDFERRGTTLLEADTDGVYFAMPQESTEADERALVAAVGAALPPLVKLEYDGRYAAMLSHEPKNYALIGYDGALTTRGVAFRSRRMEPFAETFLNASVDRLLHSDLLGMREIYAQTHRAVSKRELMTFEMTTLTRLTKTPQQYRESTHRELPYEALLAAGIDAWRVGDRIRVYRAQGNRAALLRELVHDDDAPVYDDPRDYDAAHYAALLARIYARRFAASLDERDYDVIFADPSQASLFERSLSDSRPRLTRLARAPRLDGDSV